MLSLRKRAGRWYIRGSVRIGKETAHIAEFSTGTTERAIAESIRARQVMMWVLGGVGMSDKAMTFQDLLKAYDAGYMRGMCGGSGAARNEGIRAVVEALRDEIKGERGWGLDLLDCEMIFDEILASDGVEAAGGSTREDGRQSDAVVSLYTATDGLSCTPAADFCEWEKLRTSWGFRTSCSTKWLMNENYGGDTCPLCEKAIKYKFPEGSE